MRLDGKITHGMVMDVESVGADNISFVFGPVGAYIDPSIYYTKEEIDAMLATVGVQSDWNVTDASSMAYIKNKPVLATVATSGSYNDLSNKPTIPAAQVQSNWNESDTSSKAYIQNKPTIPTVPTDVSAFNNDAGYLNGSYCPIIEDTRSQATDVNITGAAPFATLAGGQRIVLHFKYANTASPTLQLTLSGGTTTSAYSLYQNYNNGVNALTLQAMPAGSYGEFVFDQTNSRWVLVGKDYNTTYSNTSQADINNSAQGSRLIEPKLLRDNFYLKSEVNNICPIIEDTRESAVAAITGVAPFSTLVDGQRIVLRFAYGVTGTPTLELTLNGGGTTGKIGIYGSYQSNVYSISTVGNIAKAGCYVEFVYDYSNNRWITVGWDNNTVYGLITQSSINSGTNTSSNSISPKLFHDNAYIVEESYSSGSLKANKMYDFGEVTSALTIPDLDVTNDLVSNAMNFWALHFKVGELTPAGTTELSITFPQNPSGIIVDDEPTIKEGDYVEIMITKHTVGNDTDYYASIKVWQAPSQNS